MINSRDKHDNFLIQWMNGQYLLCGFGISLQSLARKMTNDNIDYQIYDDHTHNFVPNWTNVKYVIVSPGISSSHHILQTAKKKNIEILSDIDLFFMLYEPQYVIGCTGSFGKSTTVKILHEALNHASSSKFQLCGNIGIPVFDCKPQGKYIMELSSYQLEHSSKIQLNIGILLNIYKHHLDRHGSFNQYKKIKQKILHFSKNKIDVSNDLNTPHEQYSFISQGAYNAIKRTIYLYMNKSTAEQLIHNTLQNYKAMPYRCSVSFKNEKYMIINNSKATSVSAIYYSLLQQKKLWKNTQHYILLICEKFDVLPENFDQYGLTHVFFIKVNDTSCANFNKYTYVSNLKEAVQKSYLFVKKSSTFTVILYAPGVISFPQYDNFEHRGKVFDQLIYEITHSA